jgi:hypothetical protein
MPCVNVTTFLESLCLPKKSNIFRILLGFSLGSDPPAAGGRSGSSENNPVWGRQGFGSVARKLVFLLIGIPRLLVPPLRAIFDKIPDNPSDEVPFLTNEHELIAERTTTTAPAKPMLPDNRAQVEKAFR